MFATQCTGMHTKHEPIATQLAALRPVIVQHIVLCVQMLLCIAATHCAQLNLGARLPELPVKDDFVAHKGPVHDASALNSSINQCRQAIGLLEMDASEALLDHKAAANVVLSRLILAEVGRQPHDQVKEALHLAMRACSLLGLEMTDKIAESDRMQQFILQMPKLRQVLLCEALRCVGEAHHQLAGLHPCNSVGSHLANLSAAMALSEAAAGSEQLSTQEPIIGK
jgi:hypothetical protein